MEEQRLTWWEFQVVELRAGLCCGNLIVELLAFKARGRGTPLPNRMANSKFLPSLLRLEMSQTGRSCDFASGTNKDGHPKGRKAACKWDCL